MSKFNPPGMSAICPACNEHRWHLVTFENKQVRHLRCESCAAVHVCLHEGGFRSSIHPLDFADLFESGKEDALEPYRSTSAFQPTNFFKHPTLGVGYVVAILSPPTKMEVKFADKVRLLVCGPGSGTLPVPVKAARRQTLRK